MEMATNVLHYASVLVLDMFLCKATRMIPVIFWFLPLTLINIGLLGRVNGSNLVRFSRSSISLFLQFKIYASPYTDVENLSSRIDSRFKKSTL